MNRRPVLIFATTLAAFEIAGLAARASGPEPTPTPGGARLLYEETSRGTEKGMEMVHYVLRAEGAPVDHRYAVYGRRMDGSSEEVTRDVRIADSGRLIGFDGTEVDLSLGKMFLGEYVVFAIVSEDRATNAFVEITPFPIQADGKGGCRLFVKPMDAHGQVFSITGSGFEPNKKLRIVSTSVNESGRTSSEGRADGTLKNVVFPAVVGRTGGNASFEASDSACTVAVHYKWGDEMRDAMPEANPPKK